MLRMMVFIDGSWLYPNRYQLAKEYHGTPEAKFDIDYEKLPKVVCSKVGALMGVQEVDVVRIFMFASYPDRFDPQDSQLVSTQMDFYDMLREDFRYEVDLYPIDFQGRRVPFEDRKPDDSFHPKEKCVDIALATSMLYHAAIPYAYDVAVAVIGDGDFVPVLQHVRRLGRRAAIASTNGACSQ